ncbi:MAG TPA: CopD family protein [Stellaceae bacterium]|nr:CopD family protein [Stellaceae bacterium]
MVVELGNATVAIATVALILHVLSAVVWVGGMFFALAVLRPASGPLDPPARLALWHRVLDRFFRWVIAAIVLLLLSGYAMVLWVFGGFAGVGLHVNLMQAIGIVMVLIFLHVYFAPWKRFRTAMAAGDYPRAAAQLNQIRWLVTLNLVLGLVVVAVGSSGRYWG